MRLIDEIITNSSYLDAASIDMVDCVGLSEEALTAISAEVREELDNTRISYRDIEDALTLRFFIMPTLSGVDYKFYKELRMD